MLSQAVEESNMTHLFRCSVPLAVGGAIVADAIGLLSTPAAATEAEHKAHAHSPTDIWAIQAPV